MMTIRHIGLAAIAGVALGAGFSVSPAGIAVIAALATLVWWMARDLRGHERRWVMGWLLLAIAARILVVAALPLTRDPAKASFATISGGDASYMIQRSIWIANAFVHAPFAPRDMFEAFDATYGWSGYAFALALFHVLFGPSPYAAHLVSTLLFFVAAALLYRPVRASYGPVAAFAGLALLTTMPTLFLWSVAPLKEAPSYVLAGLAIRGVIVMLRPRRWWQVPLAGAVIAGALWTMHIVRPQSASIGAASLALGVCGWLAYRHRRLAAFGATAGAAVILALVLGAAPRANAFITEALTTAAKRHMGNATEPGHAYRLLDPDAYALEGDWPAGRRALARFAVRAPTRFFTAPEPWLLKPGFELLLMPQQMLWYAIVALAGLGLLTGLRRDALLSSVFAAFIIVGALAIGLNSGNIGTLIRHRDAVVPFAIWLSALGGARVIGRGSQRFNTLDAAVIVVPAVLIAAGYGLFLLFRVPPPHPESVTPSIVYTSGPVVLRGHDLRPFLRVLVAPSGESPEFRDRHQRSPEAVYAIRTSTEALLMLPSLPPGRYDLTLLDGADEAARLSNALTVNRLADDPVGVVIVEGRFTRVDPAHSRLAAGDSIASSDGSSSAQILAVGPEQPDIEWIGPGDVKTWVRLDQYVERPATLRLRCTFAAVRCYFGQQPVVADGQLALPFAAETRAFIVDAVRPDAPTWALPDGPTGDAVVDFVGWPGVERAIRPGDRDRTTAGSRSLDNAQIVRVLTTERFVGNAAVDSPVPDARIGFQAPLMRVRAAIRFRRLPSRALSFRGSTVQPGSPIEFETASYLLRGTMVAELPDGGRKP